MWRITRGCQLLWRRWDEEYIVYNTGSGNTHLLDSISGDVLRYLEEHPSNQQKLAAELAGGLDLNKTPEISSQIEELLIRFRDLGLIEFTQR
jgi:PqqD family protein of HPr-rel-A system